MLIFNKLPLTSFKRNKGMKVRSKEAKLSLFIVMRLYP